MGMRKIATASRGNYRVTFEQEGSGWRASIPEVRGCTAWGRSLSEARRKVRKSLSSSNLKNAASVARKVELVDVVRLPATAKKELERYAESRARAQAEVQALRKATRNVVSTLTAKFGISLRDASSLLGLSRERVRQLTV
jgi:hypothetical protein